MFSCPSFAYQTWRKGSLPGGWRQTATLAIVVQPRASKSVRFFPKYLPQAPLDRHRLPTDAGLKSSHRPLSDILALWKQKSALWREGGVKPERFSLVWGFLAPKRKRKPREKCLARCGRLHWLEKLPRRALAVGESPKFAAILWIAPINLPEICSVLAVLSPGLFGYVLLYLGHCAVATVAICGFGSWALVFHCGLPRQISPLTPTPLSNRSVKCAPGWQKA